MGDRLLVSQEGERGRQGEGEKGRRGEGEKGRRGEGEERENGSFGSRFFVYQDRRGLKLV